MFDLDFRGHDKNTKNKAVSDQRQLEKAYKSSIPMRKITSNMPHAMRIRAHIRRVFVRFFSTSCSVVPQLAFLAGLRTRPYDICSPPSNVLPLQVSRLQTLRICHTLQPCDNQLTNFEKRFTQNHFCGKGVLWDSRKISLKNAHFLPRDDQLYRYDIIML